MANTVRPLNKSLIVVTLLFAVSSAWGQDDNTIRLGEYFVHYDARASDVAGTGIGAVPAGVNLNANPVNTLYMAYVRRLSSKWDLELAFGVPPSTTMMGKGLAKLGSIPYAGQQVATSRWASPTLLFNYKFLEETDRLRPYVGAGVNYTRFYDNTALPAGQAAFGGPTSATMSDSWGLAGTLGLQYQVQEHWSVFASYSISQVKSTMSANTSGALRSTTIDFHPAALVLSAGYSF